MQRGCWKYMTNKSLIKFMDYVYDHKEYIIGFLVGVMVGVILLCIMTYMGE